jgi:hypothetical protein
MLKNLVNAVPSDIAAPGINAELVMTYQIYSPFANRPGFGEAPRPAPTAASRPPFKFICDGLTCGLPLGCGALEPVFRKRLLGAIKLAQKAAFMLETRRLSRETVEKFRQVFGQNPTDLWELPCCPAKKSPAGKIVADRFRAVAKELQTRTTIYRCLSAAECAQTVGRLREERPRHPTELIVSDVNALAILCKDEVLLCPSFWRLREGWQEGVILHEMFHLCFGLTCAWFQHDSNERKRNSAYCYENFALIVSGQIPDPMSVIKCSGALP